jgi:asparagine synthase (glutamine-hydrolysing)
MIEFKDKFILPEMIVALYNEDKHFKHSISDYDGKYNIHAANKVFHLEFKNVNPAPKIFETDNAFTVFIGSPVIENCIDFISANETVVNNAGNIDYSRLHTLNGEFIIFSFNKNNGTLSVINDRFSSYPFFYFQDSDALFASIYFSSLWLLLKSLNKMKINQNAFFEFYWLQRLLGNKTYAENTFFLEDASLLEFHNNSIKLQKYWNRNYTKSNASLNKHSFMMADLVKQAVTRKTSDNARYGLFLSGGMDSRTVLCAFDKTVLPVCFTSTVNENREFKKAAEIASAKNAEHIGLRLHPKHFGKIYKHSTAVIGGMYNYDHGLFYGFNDAVTSKADVCFHGHGFDYMFQGMYIPKNNIKIAGRYLYANFMKSLPNDLVEFFINNVSYRIKRADIWKYVDDDRITELKDFQHTSVNEILQIGKTLSNNPYDLWEYLTFHSLSRHYSYPNHASIATFAEQRTVAFDNDLFDLYLSLPAKHRVNGKIEKRCLKILNPDIAKIWSANTNLPVTASCWTQTFYQLAGFVKHRFIPEDDKPEWQERTWPERHDAIRSDVVLKNTVIALCAEDSILNQLEFLDMKQLRKDLPAWIQGDNVPGVSGDLVQTLITMYTFLTLNN